MAQVQLNGSGYWSDKVSRVALDLGLVKFADAPLTKERAVLASLLDSTGSEFFRGATLFEDVGGSHDQRFDSFGSATGPASRMPLPKIRRALLELLANVASDVWLPMTGLIDLVRREAPTLILAPTLREPIKNWREPKAKEKLEELYQNLREQTDQRRDSGLQLTEETPDIFLRVEGRYLQYSLEEVPFLCGFVDLARRLAPARAGTCTSVLSASQAGCARRPCARPRRRAPSYPDRELYALSTVCRLVKEDGPTYLLQLDRASVLARVASGARAHEKSDKAPDVREQLERLTGTPLPGNVAAEIDGWCGRAQKLTVYEGIALVELRGADEAAIRDELGALLLDDHPAGFLLSRKPDRTESVLEQRLRVPVVVTHRADRFSASDGPLAPPKERVAHAARSAEPAVRKVSLQVEDLVGYRCSQNGDGKVLAFLHAALERSGVASHLVESKKLLLVPAAELPKVRAALKGLEMSSKSDRRSQAGAPGSAARAPKGSGGPAVSTSPSDLPLIVQSDLTILLDVASPTYEGARDLLSGFAQLEKSPEQIHTYRLTPLSLWNAAAVGMRFEAIVDGLASLARYPVPPLVVAFVREQLGRYGRTRLSRLDENHLLLSTDDADLLAIIAGSEQVPRGRRAGSRRLEGGKLRDRPTGCEPRHPDLRDVWIQARRGAAARAHLEAQGATGQILHTGFRRHHRAGVRPEATNVLGGTGLQASDCRGGQRPIALTIAHHASTREEALPSRISSINSASLMVPARSLPSRIPAASSRLR